MSEPPDSPATRRFDLAVSLDVEGRRCVILGGGPEATDKADKLVRAGARVQIVASEIDAELAARAARDDVAWAARSWAASDLEGAFLVYVTQDERDRAGEAWLLRRTMGFLMCSIDEPPHCDFANNAIVRAGSVTLAISTGGRAPALAKRLREALEASLATPELVAFVEALVERRDGAPEGERGAVGKQSVEGLAVDVRVTYPEWFRGR